MSKLYELCENVKSLVRIDRYDESRKLICNAMAEYPDAAEPHNLMGVILEKQSDHVGAMKHFRAAWALNPSYTPARENMDQFARFETTVKLVF